MKQRQHSAFLSREVHSRPASHVQFRKRNNEESTGEKASKYNGRVYHDIATVKESDEDKSLGRKNVWHISAKETVNFKRSKFFRAKSDMPKDMCAFMQQEMSRGYPISII